MYWHQEEGFIFSRDGQYKNKLEKFFGK